MSIASLTIIVFLFWLLCIIFVSIAFYYGTVIWTSLDFFFLQNNTHFQKILLVSINFKLFRKLISWVRKTRFYCSNLSIKDSIFIKFYTKKTQVPQKKKMQVSSSRLFLFSKQPILLVSFSSQNKQRKMKEVKALPLPRPTKEKAKKPKVKTKKPIKQRQRNLASKGREIQQRMV